MSDPNVFSIIVRMNFLPCRGEGPHRTCGTDVDLNIATTGAMWTLTLHGFLKTENCLAKIFKSTIAVGYVEGKVWRKTTDIPYQMCYSLDWDDSVITKTGTFWDKKILLDIPSQGFQKYLHGHKSTKLQKFQYRLLHNKIFWNNILYHWKLVNSQHCDFCTESNKEDIVHLHYYCSFTQKIWKVLFRYDRENLEFNPVNFKCTLWSFKEQLTLKMRVCYRTYRISNVLLLTSLYCPFRDTIV